MLLEEFNSSLDEVDNVSAYFTIKLNARPSGGFPAYCLKFERLTNQNHPFNWEYSVDSFRKTPYVLCLLMLIHFV